MRQQVYIQQHFRRGNALVILIVALQPREVSRKPLDALCFCCYRPSQSKLPILLGVEVAKSEQWQCIPTRLSIEQFQQFVLPHLSIGSRGPAPKLTLHAVFNYILQSLYLGCQWKELPIEKDLEGRPEIHYTRIYGAFRRWQADGCFEAVFAGSVLKLHQANLLDTTVIHGDGTTTAAKKGGDNIGFSGHKKVKGDKIVAFCDRHCNVIAPFVSAPGNRNESPLLREALPLVTRIATQLALTVKEPSSAWMASTIAGRIGKPFSIVEWFPISTRILAVEKSPNEVASRSSTPPFSKNGSIPSSACSVGKISSGDYCCDLNGSVSYTTHLRPWPIR
jgi:transposase